MSLNWVNVGGEMRGYETAARYRELVRGTQFEGRRGAERVLREKIHECHYVLAHDVDPRCEMRVDAGKLRAVADLRRAMVEECERV
jgi:hypothetical protein